MISRAAPAPPSTCSSSGCKKHHLLVIIWKGIRLGWIKNCQPFVYAHNIIISLFALIINRATCEGFTTNCMEHSIVQIFESGDPMMLGNNQTIMIGFNLVKICGSILVSELSLWTEICDPASCCILSKFGRNEIFDKSC